MQTVSDLDLVNMIKAGNHLAFSELYQRYKIVLYLHIKKMLNNEDETKDIIQETFTYIWVNRLDLNISTSVKSYLYTTVRNKVLNVITHQKFENNYLNSLQNIIEIGEFSTDEKIRENELITLIERGIENLPAKMREVFELSRKYHLSHKQISEKLNISDKTVKKQISNAIKILRLEVRNFILLFSFI